MPDEGYTPTTDEVRAKYAWLADVKHPSFRKAAEFDRWLAAHDHEVRVEYEERRKPDPIHVDNIDGQNAAQWLAARDEARDREVAARAVEAAQDRLVSQDQFSERTLRILDELAAALRSGTEGSAS